ncbi:MAG: hypothetical protein P8X63_01465, partial [Desulfuromonadaceae bacterium]
MPSMTTQSFSQALFSVCLVLFLLAPLRVLGAESWLDVLREADIFQDGSTYNAVLYDATANLSWNDANGNGDFDNDEVLIGSIVVQSPSGSIVSPAGLSGAQAETWAEDNAEEIYRIFFPAGFSQAMGTTEEAFLGSTSISNHLKRVSPKAKKNLETVDSDFKAAVEYDRLEVNDEDGDAFSLVMGYNHLFDKTEIGFLLPYRYTDLDDNIDSKSHLLALELYLDRELVNTDSFTLSLGGEIFGSLYYLTSDAIEHLGQIKYGAGLFTVADIDLPFGQLSVALDYKISEMYVPDSLLDYDDDNVFLKKGIEYIDGLDTVHTITYGFNYGLPLMGEDLALNVEVLRSHFESDDISSDRDTRTTATLAVCYYPTESFELTLGIKRVFEVDEFEELGVTFGSSHGLLVGCLLVLLMLLVWAGQGMAADEVVYTRYNIHVEKRFSNRGDPVYRASYANYIYPPSGQHIILPPNTRILPINKRRLFTKNYGFQVIAENYKVIFEFDKRRMGMDFEQYMDLITSPQPVTLPKLSDIDRKGVTEGRPHVGMSKKGIMMALGYPAAHKTPSLDDNTWTYWKDRF